MLLLPCCSLSLLSISSSSSSSLLIMMEPESYICTCCGTQYPPRDGPPSECPICQDERQYIPAEGQKWTTMEELRKEHRNEWKPHPADPHLISFHTTPQFAIGQRALLVQTPEGNILWDCISLLDDYTIRRVRELGGIAAIAISHPHFYGSMAEWSKAFGGAPIYLCSRDKAWVQHDCPWIQYWGAAEEDQRLPLANGLVEVVRCGGHFDGSSVLYWKQGSQGRGALLTSDTISITADRKHVSFMWSFPNLIPLDASAVLGIWRAVAPLPFHSLYGGWLSHDVLHHGKDAVDQSVRRYLQAIGSSASPDVRA